MAEKKDSQHCSEYVDEEGIAVREYAAVSTVLYKALKALRYAGLDVKWGSGELRNGMYPMIPLMAFAVLFSSFIDKLYEGSAARGEIDKFYALSNRQKVDIFLSKDIPGALFDLGFSDEFISIVCKVLKVRNTVSGKVRKIAASVRAATVEAVSPGTSWLSVSEVKKALVDSGEVELIDTIGLGSGKPASFADVGDEKDLGTAQTVIAPLDLDDTLRGGKQD